MSLLQTGAITLPSWAQFVLTLAGGWLAGVGSAVVAFWRRLVTFEKRVDGRLQAIEQTIYGRRGEAGGLVADVAHTDRGVARIEKLLVRICAKLGIEDGME